MNYPRDKMKNEKLTIIYEKRLSAMKNVNDNLICNLNKLMDIKLIEFKTLKYHNNFIRKFEFLYELLDSFRVFFMIRRTDKILFTEPKKIIVKLFSLLPNKKYVILHHVDEKDLYTCKWFPFFNLTNTLKRYNIVFCPSKFTQKQVHFLKTQLFDYGINHSIFYPRKKTKQAPYILSVGTERPRKNMENLLKSFKIIKKTHPNLKLIKLGVANQVDRKRTLGYIKKLGLKDIIFKGFMDYEDIPSYYSNAELLLFPSLLEGGGFPPMEAMACGCPVVTSNIPPMNEISYCQMLADPLDPKDLAEKCNMVLSDDTLKKELIKKGIKRAKDFDWRKSAETIYKHIKEDNVLQKL
jgi:glycosyltransferase involved in cell wall biosynthesis